jgi:hypothetical protein
MVSLAVLARAIVQLAACRSPGYEVHDDRPAQAAAHGEARAEVHLDGRLLVTTSTLDLDGSGPGRRRDVVRYRFRRELRSDGLVIRERTWDRRFPGYPWCLLDYPGQAAYTPTRSPGTSAYAGVRLMIRSIS